MKKRIITIDILRAFSIFCMIQVHIFYYWTNMNYDNANLVILYFGQLAAPIFLIVSGCSFYLYISKKVNENIARLEIFKEISKRAVFIFSISLVFQILFGFIMELKISFIIYWSIFQVIAFSMIIYFFIPFLKRELRIFTLFLIFFLLYLIYFLIQFYNIEYLAILVSGGDYTFLPWASLFIFGILIGDLIINMPTYYFKICFIIFFPIGIIILIIWWLWFKDLRIDWWIVSFISAFSTFFIVFPLLYYFADIKEYQSKLLTRGTQWGRFSFSIYYLHFGVIAIGILIFPFIIPDLFSRGFLLYQFIIIVIMFYIGIELFLRVWKKLNYIFGIEWFLNFISKKELFSND
ncbi:MAG: heparan-alpha-glucosaminide N-acetyltransferase domain-containing protein [Candidatus Hodarchaeota archaeon]